VLALPGLPLLLAVGWIIVQNPSGEPPLVVEAIIAFNVAMALFFGGLRLFAKIRGRIGPQ
jgi:O-antigen ligase